MIDPKNRGFARRCSVAAGLLVALAASASTVAFKAVQTYPVGTNPTSVAIADFNGDGKPDLAVVNNGSNSVSVLLGKGDGTFRPASTFNAQSPSNNIATIAIGDFNGDGRPDVAVLVPPDGDVAPSKVYILFGNGDGTLQAPIATTLEPHAAVAAVADVNGDKKADLVVNLSDASGNGTGVEVLLGNGDGTFQTSKTVVTDPENVLIVADFNNDGKPDLAINNSTTVLIMLGQGDGTFSQGGQAMLTDGYAVGRAWAADLNGDGYLDLVVDSASYSSAGFNYSVTQNVSAFLSTASGGFGSEQTFAKGSASGFEFGPLSNTLVTDVATADFNGDGRLDIANRANTYARFGKTSNAPFTVNLGNATGKFTPVSLADPGPLGSAADLNGDQLTDLIVLDSANNSIGVLLNATPAFAMSASTMSLTATAGEQVTDKLSFRPVNGFSSAIQLSCQVTGPAPAPTCSLSPADIPAGANSSASTLTVSVPASSAGFVSPHTQTLHPLYALGIPLALLGILGVKPRGATAKFRLRLVLLSTLAGLGIACGGSSNQRVQQAQSYTVQVTAASDTITKTLPISLTAP